MNNFKGGHVTETLVILRVNSDFKMKHAHASGL